MAFCATLVDLHVHHENVPFVKRVPSVTAELHVHVHVNTMSMYVARNTMQQKRNVWKLNYT